MVTLGGFILSGGLGLVARRLQVSLIGRSPATTSQQVSGYVLSTGFFLGSYYYFAGLVENNRTLLNRRLEVLREQRAKQELFNEFTEQEDHKMTAAKRENKFFNLFERYGSKYNFYLLNDIFVRFPIFFFTFFSIIFT